MKRLRVLSVINALHFGGDESRLLALSKAIDRTRFEHLVLTLKRTDPALERERGACRPHFEAAGIPVADLGEEPLAAESAHGSLRNVVRSVPRLTRTLKKLAAFVRSHRIDVIDAHVGTANQLGALAGIMTGCPAIVTTYQLEQFRPLWLWNASEVAAFSMASAIVTDSEAVAREILRKLVRPRPVAVIPNGIEPPASTRTREEMRAEFNIPADPRVRVIGQVSALSRRKGHMVLLDAARRLTQQDAYLHFLICGFPRPPFEYAQEVQERAAELGIAQRITFVSYPGPIGDVYKAIDLQVHAALAESLPNAIIEGMALGKPAVVTAIAGIPSMVADGQTGLVVPPNDADALADALLRLLKDPAVAERLGAAARERYLARYTDRRMAESLEALFTDVARGDGRRFAS